MNWKGHSFLFFLLWMSFINLNSSSTFERPVWGYKCEEFLQQRKCKKTLLTDENFSDLSSLEVCRIFCDWEIGTLWPMPSEPVNFDRTLRPISPKKIQLQFKPSPNDIKAWAENQERFMQQILAKVEDETIDDDADSLIVDFRYEQDSSELSLNTDESYTLSISEKETYTLVEIFAKTFYGARHGLETLSQLIVYDDINKQLKCASNVQITDAPRYKHRGISFDTSRTFFSKEAIKKTIDTMAMVKMNVFHWHITDSASFPIYIKSHPEFTKYGAYSKKKVYMPEDVKEIVRFAKDRGIRVLPEFDVPAHVGEGWQHTDLTLCFHTRPYQYRGQLNPSKDKLYDLLEDIYRDFIDMFGTMEIFHMGNDEVNLNCWNSSTELRNWMYRQNWDIQESDYMRLWGYFQEKALERFDKVNPTKSKIPIIVWTSSLTEEPYLTQYLDKNRYIIQIWTSGDDPRVQKLLEKGYNLIMSNYELYLDCGFSSIFANGLNWCAPYKTWRKLYDNDLRSIAGNYIDQILGAEAALWSEQIDEVPMESRVWPRLSALAERLWTDPESGWQEAEPRMLMHHKRLVQMGIKADRLQPEWCLQNEGDCPSN